MSFVGSPSWTMINGLPAIKQNAATDYVTSTAVPMSVDVLSEFFFESVFSLTSGGLWVNILTQGGVGGGFSAYWVSATNQVLFYLFNAAGAYAEQINTPVGSILPNRKYHLIMQSLTAGTNGLVWINGVPVAPVLMLAGVVAAGVNSAIVTAGNSDSGARNTTILSRLWRGRATNSDAQALYGAAHILTGGEV